MTSEAFQEFGNVEVAKEQLTMSFNGLRITGRQSLMIRMLTLSGPGDLLEGIDDTISSTRVKITRVKSQNLQAIVNVGLSYTWRYICVACVADDYFFYLFFIPFEA